MVFFIINSTHRKTFTTLLNLWKLTVFLISRRDVMFGKGVEYLLAPKLGGQDVGELQGIYVLHPRGCCGSLAL